ITDFYNGDYRFGPAIDYRQVLRFYEENAALVRLDAPQTAINERSLDYRIEEDIYAGYGMVSLAIGDLTAIGGVRVERTEGRYDAFSIRSATGITPLTFDKKYTDVLPSVHLNYRPRPDVILRAAWTNTIGRPNYDASVPTFAEDNGAGTAGNPDLEPYKSLGFDLSAEYYPDTDSIFSVGLFYKRLENPIFTRTLRNTSFAGVPLLTLSQPQNADRGELFGIEANLQRRLTFLPAPLDGFGVSVNGTYVTSDVTVPGREDEDIPFFRQSDFTANASLFFEHGGFEARVAVNYRDDFIENVGASTASDVYQKARTVIDARASYQVTRALTVFGSLSNLNEAPNTFYQTNRDQIFSREIYSFNGDVGVSLRF
ncbi:TonB-dependent receptor domain-containing protein, partial [uncultured Sphingomonas sp.]|uniref:TonB-dependent receptor domain-containing protein n=1 Tax=uncultured Sphingomonas sp. TaxID=158754 RepID=UPI0035CBA904